MSAPDSFDFQVIAAEADAFLANLEARDPELMASYKERRDALAPTFLQNWPEALTALSIPHAGIELTGLERRALIDAFLVRERDTPKSPETMEAGLESIKGRLRLLIDRFPEGAFVRLGSRSPKDSWIGQKEGFRVTDAARAVALLIDSMERVYRDLSDDDYAGATSWIFVRAWRDIPTSSEFRCVVKGGRLAGVTQYDCRQVFPEIAGNEAAIRNAVQSFFVDKFRHACPLEDVVFDVFLTGNPDNYEATLLEINPYGISDPGALSCQEIVDWDGGETLFRCRT